MSALCLTDLSIALALLSLASSATVYFTLVFLPANKFIRIIESAPLIIPPAD